MGIEPRILSSINRLEGVFDLDKNKIKNISKIFSCNGYESLDDINNNKEIKNVFIITNATSHFSVLKNSTKKKIFLSKNQYQQILMSLMN